MNQPDEPLALSAPLARQMAPQLCWRDPATGQDCAWYHGLWQDLRVIGLAASPHYQAEFYRDAFQRLDNPRHRLRVLISGAADYSILAQVLWAGTAHRLVLDITVIDLCDTPLFLNNWYADRAGKKIATVRSDIFAYRPDAPFDVVCSHSFMGRLPPPQRSALVAHWSGLLTPTGSVVAVNRVRPTGTSHEVRFSDEEGRAFCATVAQRIRALPSLAEADAAVILDRARIYVQRLTSYAMTTNDLTMPFEQTGFRIDNLTTVVSNDPRNLTVSGKAIPRNATHACIVAKKAHRAA